MNRRDWPKDPPADDTEVDVRAEPPARPRAPAAPSPGLAARPTPGAETLEAGYVDVPDPMVAAPPRAVLLRETIIRRNHSVTRSDEPARPEGAPVLLRVQWVRVSAAGLHARRRAVDVVTLSGRAESDGALEIALDDRRWRVAIEAHDSARRVARRLQRRISDVVDVEMWSNGTEHAVFFRGPREPRLA